MSVVDAFFGTGNELDRASLGDEALRRLRPWLERWSSGKGPAFLPRQHDGTLSWYGLMDDGPQRRELEQLLQHWVGPGCSDVHLRRGTLDAQDTFDDWLTQELPGRVVRLDVRPRSDDDQQAFKESRDLVRSRLEDLVRMLDRRPEHRRVATIGLGGALDDVYLRAASGDAAGAEELVRALERRRMLDAPNTAFVRLRILSLSGQPEAVLASPELADLDGQHLPRGIANLVASAVADAVVEGAEDPGEAVRSLPRHVRHALGQANPADPAAASVPLHLEEHQPTTTQTTEATKTTETIAPYETARVTDDSLDVETAPVTQDDHTALSVELDGQRAYSLWLEADHDTLLTEFTSAATRTDDVVEWAILAADTRGGYEAAATVLDVLDQEPREWKEATWRLPGAAEAYARLRIRRDGSIASWDDWFDAVASGDDVPEGVLDDAIEWEPLTSDTAVDWLDRVGADVLVPVLGRFLATHREKWTVDERATLSPRLLEALALSERAGRDVRGWGYTLTSDALDGSLSNEARSDVLEALRLLLSQQLNKGTIAWALDIVGEVTDAWGGVDKTACLGLLNDALQQLRDCRSALTSGDVRTLSTIVESFSMEVPGDLSAHLNEQEDVDPLACHAGKSILIYSLRERSARQAASRLAQLPGTFVTLSNAKAGSAQLAGQVAGADLVVIVTAAAKHAATDFIEERSSTDPLLVNTAGMSGLIAALEMACQ